LSTVSALAYKVIRSLILEGRFIPGERLKEEELTDLCGVSRTPVREALRRLALEGLVVLTPHQGAQVAEIGEIELQEIYALRAMIESHAAGRAAKRIALSAIARLKVLAGQMEDAVAQAVRRRQTKLYERYTTANSEFHRIIMEAADSPRLSAMATLVVEVPLILRTLARYSESELSRSLHHHRELIEAFEARDEDWASSVMRCHIRAAAQAVVRPEGEAEPAGNDQGQPLGQVG
jgi:DNA-binding GntR family transcriptional regulator